MTIRELMDEQRRRARSGDPAERFAAALMIPAELSRRLRLLADFQVGRLLDDEVCPNMSLLAPEATVCAEAALRLRRPMPSTAHARRLPARMSGEGEHVLHAEIALYRAGISYLQLPWQKDRFASSTFFVKDVEQARACLLQADFREVSHCTPALIHDETSQAIHLYEDTTRLCSTTEED